MSSSVMYIKRLLRKGKKREASRQKVTQTHITHSSSHYPTRQCVSMSKKKNEPFGFEIKTYNEKNSNDHELVTRVFSVRENSPAENGGLRTGDIIVSVNNVSVQGFAHQQFVDLIQTSFCLLRIEIVRDNFMKHNELHKKLNYLQWQLKAKWEELQMLIAQEERLQGSTGCILNQCWVVLEHLNCASNILL